MSEHTESALTREEWEALEIERGGWTAEVERWGPKSVVALESVPPEAGLDVMEEDAPALAALLLRGYFSREMVDRLRQVQYLAERWDEAIPEVGDLADRIEALLPPEEET